jgi:ATP-binding cassette subfamily F protein uup
LIVSHDRYFLDKLTDHLFIFEGEGVIRDHYGKYSTYRAALPVRSSTKKNADQAGPDADKSKETRSGKKAAAKKTRLTFKEQQEYDSLEPEIESLEQEKSALEEELNAGTLDYESLHQKSQRVSELIQLIDEKVQRWMELGEFVNPHD